MSKQITSLRGVTIAAISVSLSLPMLPIAQAQQAAQAPMHPQKHIGRIHRPKSRESEVYPKHIYSSAPNQPDCTWPYKGMVPPCMSTWPEGDPNYHGNGSE